MLLNRVNGLIELPSSPFLLPPQWIRFVFALSCSCVLEALSTQNDNILVPLYLYSLSTALIH
jgi:dolichol kinase